MGKVGNGVVNRWMIWQGRRRGDLDLEMSAVLSMVSGCQRDRTRHAGRGILHLAPGVSKVPRSRNQGQGLEFHRHSRLPKTVFGPRLERRSVQMQDRGENGVYLAF